MDAPLELTSHLNTYPSNVLVEHFERQLAAAQRYGHTSWHLLRWSPDVCYRWGHSANGEAVRRHLESIAPVLVDVQLTGLTVRLCHRTQVPGPIYSSPTVMYDS